MPRQLMLANFKKYSKLLGRPCRWLNKAWTIAAGLLPPYGNPLPHPAPVSLSEGLINQEDKHFLGSLCTYQFT